MTGLKRQPAYSEGYHYEDRDVSARVLRFMGAKSEYATLRLRVTGLYFRKVLIAVVKLRHMALLEVIGDTRIDGGCSLIHT